ncbi:hypothetical protein ACFQY7_03430 [Actinomadura luteofluorescens]|uniref:hypothetical protein n=1 Tax=Actinomadura luteofluorescens TaxID=46163 RepID=UPI00362BE045
MRGPRTLRARLTAGLLVLLALSCLAVGIATATALDRFLMGRLDEQLTASGGRFPASLEHERRRDADDRPDTRGQAPGTFGARLFGGKVTEAAVVRDSSDEPVPLDAADRRALAALRPDGRARSLDLSALEEYRVMALRGDDGDVLVTGLPLRPAEETLHRVILVEAVVFAAVLAAAGSRPRSGSGWPCARCGASPRPRPGSPSCRWPAGRSRCPSAFPTPTPAPRSGRSGRR